MSRKAGIILSAIVGIIVGLWLWAAIIPKNSIQIGGSTSVSNLMTDLTNAYKDDQKGDSFIYSSVGSAGGINNAKSGTYKMGFISKDLDDSANYVTTKYDSGSIAKYFKDSKKQNSDPNAMHYVQIANDAIIIAYQAPDWFEKNYSADFNITFSGNKVADNWKTLMKDIYAGGFNWSQVAKQLEPNSDVNAAIKSGKDADAEVQAFASAAGSGTRSAFEDEFGFNEPGTSDLVKTHPSVRASDGFMFSSIKKNSIGYLSMNYLDEIKSSDLKTVLVQGVNAKEDTNFIADVANNNYKLTRPYIGLIKNGLSDDDLDKIGKFLDWIATASNGDTKKGSAYSQYKDAGIAPKFELDNPNLLPKDNRPETKSEVINKTQIQLRQTIDQGYLPRK